MPPDKRNRRGQEIIELALVLPLLLVIFAGGAEFGRAFYTYNILTKSVRNAARYLSASEMSLAGVIPTANVTRTKNMAVYGNATGSGSPIVPGLTTGLVDVTSQTAGVNRFYVTVAIRYTYQPLFTFLMPTSPLLKPKETMIFVGYISGT